MWLYLKKNGTTVAVSQSVDNGTDLVSANTSIFFREKVAIDSTFEFCMGASSVSVGEKINENWLQYGFQIYGPGHKWHN